MNYVHSTHKPMIEHEAVSEHHACCWGDPARGEAANCSTWSKTGPNTCSVLWVLREQARGLRTAEKKKWHLPLKEWPLA